MCKGVAKTASGKFSAQISLCGAMHKLGVFTTEEKAAERFDLAFIALHGHRVGINFPERDYSQNEIAFVRAQLDERLTQRQMNQKESARLRDGAGMAANNRKLREAKERYSHVTESLRKAPRIDRDHFYHNSVGQRIDPFSLSISLC